MQKTGFVIFTMFSSFWVNAQTKTISGYVKDNHGNGLANLEMTLDTQGQEKTTTATDGAYQWVTNNFPTAANDIARQDNVKIWPNPSQTKAHMQLPALEGTLEAYDLNGKFLGKTDLENRDALTFNATNLALIRYTAKDGTQITKKLLIEQGNHNITVQAENDQEMSTKSAMGDTFGYKGHIKGIAQVGMNKRSIDTLINITNFFKDEVNHEQDFTIPMPKHKTINGRLTNIQTDEGIADAYLLAWNGETLIYTKTDANGDYSLPSQGINQIKIIKPGFQTRTTYNETKNDTIIDWNIYDTATFPLQAIMELTGDETKHFKNKPTVYFIKNDKYPIEDYQPLEQLIKDVDGMSLGNTKDLEIKYISSVDELQAINDDDHSFIFVKFLEAQNSTWGYQLTNDRKLMRYASIDIIHLNEGRTYYDFSEEFGSAYLGAWQPLRNVDMQSTYHFDANFNTQWYQPVDTLVAKFHFTRLPNAKASDDSVPNESGMNGLDTKGEIQKLFLYEQGEFKEQNYNNLPTIIKQEIEEFYS